MAQKKPDRKIPVWSWRHAIVSSDAPPLTRLVCLVLANYVSDVGAGCWPGTKLLLGETGLSNKTLTEHLKRAVKAGLLEIRRVPGAKGTFGYYHYYPRFPKNVELPPPTDEGSDEQNVSQNCGPPDVGDTPGLPDVAPSTDQVYFAPDPGVGDTPKLSKNTPRKSSKSARKGAAGRPSQSDLENQAEEEPMGLTPSPDAKARGLKVAKGWSYEHLIDEFREMNNREDAEPIRDVDAAWLGFCRHVGPNPDKPTFRVTGPITPLEEAPAGTVPITRLGSEWQLWIDYLRGWSREDADRMGHAKTFIVYVPSKLPPTKYGTRPHFPRPKVAA